MRLSNADTVAGLKERRGSGRNRVRTPRVKSNLEETLAMQLRAARIQFEREHTFATPRKFRFDFIFNQKLAVECEGGSFVGGAHGRPLRFQRDSEKYNLATELGWRVLRYTMADIKSGAALAQIERVLNAGVK